MGPSLAFGLEGGGYEILRLDLPELVSVQVGDGQIPEDIVQDAGRHLDVVVPLNHAVGLEAGEGKGVDVFFQGYPVLKAEGYGDGEGIQDASKGRPFLVHVQEDLSEAPIVVFAGSEEYRMAGDLRLLGIALSPVGQGFADSPGGGGQAGQFGLFRGTDQVEGEFRLLGFGFVQLSGLKGDDRVGDHIDAGGERRKGLGELGAVPVEGYGLEHGFPRQHVGALDVLGADGVGHVDSLGDRAGYEGLCGRHHGDMRLPVDASGSLFARRRRRVEYRQILVPEAGGPFQAHGAAGVEFGLLHFAGTEAQASQEVEGGVFVFFGRKVEGLHLLLSENMGRKAAFQGKGALQGRLYLGNGQLAEAFLPQGRQTDPRSLVEASRAQGVAQDFLARPVVVAQGF